MLVLSVESKCRVQSKVSLPVKNLQESIPVFPHIPGTQKGLVNNGGYPSTAVPAVSAPDWAELEARTGWNVVWMRPRLGRSAIRHLAVTQVDNTLSVCVEDVGQGVSEMHWLVSGMGLR